MKLLKGPNINDLFGFILKLLYVGAEDVFDAFMGRTAVLCSQTVWRIQYYRAWKKKKKRRDL